MNVYRGTASNHASEVTSRDIRASSSLHSSFCRMEQCCLAKRPSEKSRSPVLCSDLLVDQPSSLWHEFYKIRHYYPAESLSTTPKPRTLILQEERKTQQTAFTRTNSREKKQKHLNVFKPSHSTRSYQ